ncbi:MAG: hypothetical protein AB1429_17775 [Pseudomonadota bacterium]|jgi:hypothetical protein
MARFWHGLSIAAALVLATPAAAVPPPLDYPTDIVVPFVPQGWKVSTLKAGGYYQQLGEFTPTGVSTDTFTDLVGFTVLPSSTVLTRKPSLAELANIDLSPRCAAHSARTLQPAKADAEWKVVEYFCVVKDGPAAGEVDLTFTANRARPHALFTVWRAWRGSPEAFRAFLKATAGVDAAGLVAKDGGLAFDEAVLDRATPAILAAWSDTFTKAEVCDLALGEICPTYRAPQTVPPPYAADAARLGLIGQLHLAGSHEWTSRQAIEQMSKMSGSIGELGRNLLQSFDQPGGQSAYTHHFDQSIAVSNHDFSRQEGMIAALLLPVLSSHVDGGDLVILDDAPPADPALRARLQAYLVTASHLAWLLHISPDRQTLTLYPPKP